MVSKKVTVEPILFETYPAVIKNSVGSRMWRSSYAKVIGVNEEQLHLKGATRKVE